MRTVGDKATGDWSYRDARRRLVLAGRRHLQRHAASVRLDEAANPIVDCGCGWTGNAIGWAGHLGQVVGSSLDGGETRSAQG
jgi:hypothetical protein